MRLLKDVPSANLKQDGDDDDEKDDEYDDDDGGGGIHDKDGDYCDF